MAVDIRRMSKAELDELNRLGKEWRERNKPDQNPPEPKSIPTVQMNLWEKEEKRWPTTTETFQLCARDLRQVGEKKAREKKKSIAKR